MQLYSISKQEAEKLLNQNLDQDGALINDPAKEYLARHTDGKFEPLEHFHLNDESVIGFFVLVE